MLNEPCRCTVITSDQSDQLMRWKMRSRRMPALFTRMSTRPNASSAACTIWSAFCGSPIDSVEAIASPPAFLISSTTCCAGPTSPPEPSSAAPTSFTTTLAPSSAISIAMARPMPRPAPVTMATLPSTMPAIVATPIHTRSSPRVDPGAIVLLDLEEKMDRRVKPGDDGVAPALPPPHLVRHLDDQPQLRPLLVLGQHVALLGRGEAALRRQAELVERRRISPPRRCGV